MKRQKMPRWKQPVVRLVTPVVQGDYAFLSLHVDTVAEAEQLFKVLAEKGKVVMPLEQTFWAARFGMLHDQFGMKWMINCEQK
jgi:PhnB protein